MPYLIAAVVVIVGAVAFTFMRAEPTTEPEVTTLSEEVRLPEEVTDEEPMDPAGSGIAEEQSEEDPDLSVVSEVNEDVRPSDPDLTEFADGTYTTQTSYFTPRRTEHTMDVTFTLEDDVVTDVSILWDGAVEPKTPSHTGFDEAYKAEVVGQPLNEIYLSRVGGASLTSESFNEAVQTVEAEASAS